MDGSSLRDTHRDAETAVVVWVVTGSVGEYSDRSEWAARAFESEADAKAFVERMDALGRDWWTRFSENRWSEDAERDGATAAIKAEEPEWDNDYTGPAEYTAVPVPFVAAKATTPAETDSVGTETLQASQCTPSHKESLLP